MLASYLNLWRIHRSYPSKRISRLPKTKTGSSDALSAEPKPKRDHKADIVIPIYNNYNDTKVLLEQLRHEAAEHRSIILVNDCSTDDRMSPMLADYCKDVPKAFLIENERNLGFVKTCNSGIEIATSDVVILNTDIELPRGAVTRIVTTLRSADDIATVTPFSNSAYGVGIPNLIRHNERPFGAETNEIDRAFQSLNALAPIDVPRGVGFCMAMSRTVIDRIGPFSLDYGQGYGEEADFCMRARNIGFRSVIAPNVYVYHKGGQSFGGTWQKKARAGQLLFLSRHPGFVKMMRDYLENCEARAAAFMALVALSRNLSGQQPTIVAARYEPNDTSPENDKPFISVTDCHDKIAVRISMKHDDYAFHFVNLNVARNVFLTSQLPFPFE